MYYDVTQLVHWSGRITGIPRVMEELARRYQIAYPETVFVSWVKELQEFCEIDLTQSLERRGHGIVYITRGSSTEKTMGVPVAVPNSLAKQSKHFAVRATKGSLRRAARVSPTLSGRVEKKLQVRYLQQHKQVQFKKGDQLFIPWGEWWDPNFIVKLEELHAAGGKIIQILHDMSPVVVPQFSNSGNATETFPVYCKRIFPICDLILSVSENSKRDALQWMKAQKLQAPPVKVFRLGDDIQVSRPTRPEDFPLGDRETKEGFLMMVGTIEIKKNHQLLYYVYKLANERGIKLPKMVIAGRLGWMSEATVELMAKDPVVKDQFIFMLNKSDEELSWLYDRCLFTVLPSFYEGWGIPIAESVARGVPCLCSNTSSMTEIAEGYVQHFSPHSTDECLRAITDLLEPSHLAAAKKKVAGYKQSSWDDSFRQVDGYVKETIR